MSTGRKIKGTAYKAKKASKNVRSRYVERRPEVYGILIIMASILLFISILNIAGSGYVNNSINNFLSYIFGIGKFMIPFLLLIWGLSFFFRKIRTLPSRFGWGFFLLFFSILGILSHNLRYSGIFDRILVENRGGIAGAGIFYGLYRLFGSAGALTVLSAILILSLLIITKISLINLAKKIIRLFKNLDFSIFKEIFKKERAETLVPILKASREEEDKVLKEIKLRDKRNEAREAELIDNFRRNPVKEESSREDGTKAEQAVKKEEQLRMPVLRDSDEDDYYRLPPDSLLKKSKSVPTNLYRQNIRERVSTLNRLFNDFNLPAKVTKVIYGPSITLYELVLSPGVKVQKLFSLEDDFCVALGSPDLRILAPIPGKSAIGIEVPNKIRSLVTLGDIYSGQDRNIFENLLNVPLGKNLSGEIAYMDIGAMPHVLIAGATNSGKSSCLNSIIISLIMKVKPNEVKFIMIDPKMVELSIYNGIPHLLSPVVINPKKAASALSWAVEEMENRFKILVERNFKSLVEYNAAAAESTESGDDFKPLPYILIFIDELADLMMVSASEVEDSICRVAQMGRAVGMHLIISTQRPSVNVITGLIKANIPSRIAFMVTSNIDSRVILDCSGADKLIGRGDMLYLPYYSNRPERIQGSFVTSKEIEMIVRYIKGIKESEYNIEISRMIDKKEKKIIEEDELFYDALKVVVDFGHASASLLQRRLKLGYSRAARIIDQLENRSYISGFEGSKPREVLVSKEELNNILRDKEK